MVTCAPAGARIGEVPRLVAQGQVQRGHAARGHVDVARLVEVALGRDVQARLAGP